MGVARYYIDQLYNLLHWQCQLYTSSAYCRKLFLYENVFLFVPENLLVYFHRQYSVNIVLYDLERAKAFL